jgi:alcohol dehydrogenase class IV
LSNELKKINKKLNIPLALKGVTEVNIPEDKFLAVLERMSQNAFNDPCTLTNPRPSSPQDVAMIYKSAYSGTGIS